MTMTVMCPDCDGAGRMPTYGHAIVSDPRDFVPDEQDCTAEELAAHAAALEAAGKGESFPDHRPWIELVGRSQTFTNELTGETLTGTVVHATGSLWGVGTNWFACDHCKGAGTVSLPEVAS